MEPTSVIALHGLGMDRAEFFDLGLWLEPQLELQPVDLPGFGRRAAAEGIGLDAMTALVRGVVRTRAHRRFLLVGHSMGGKVATIVAHDLRGSADEPAGVVLLAGSPPSPEPMDEGRRRQMLSWVDDGPLDREAARAFVDANVGAPLPQHLDDLALGSIVRSAPAAWRSWLEHGSREDRSAEVGALDVPALIVAGGADGDLGEAAQRAHNQPVYPHSHVEVLDGAGHLLPLERPQQVARLITSFDDALRLDATGEPSATRGTASPGGVH